MFNFGLGGIFTLISIVVLGVMGYALVDVLRRSPQQFTFARQSKQFWTMVLGGAVLFYALFRIGPLWLPLEQLISLAFLVATIYYLGPECQIMGRPDNGGINWRNRGDGNPPESGSAGDWRRW